MIDITRIPIYGRCAEEAKEKGQEVPYLKIDGEDEPIDFLFTLQEKHNLIARANLHTVKGAPKTGKSAFGLVLMAAALRGEYMGIKASGDNLHVLWIDTEQDRNTVRGKGRAVLEMSEFETQPERLKVVSLRGCGEPADAMDLVERAIKETGPDLVFLDGVVDLCEAFNDEEPSREVVRRLESLAEQIGAAIVGIIHTNKKDNEARGHLGTIMVQKSAEIYQVSKENNLATVKQGDTRFASVPDFTFAFAEDFKIIPPAEVWQRAEEEAREKMRSTFAPLFEESKKLTYTELAEAYKCAQNCGERKAKNAISAAVKADILCKSQEGRNVYYSYLFPSLDIPDDDEDL